MIKRNNYIVSICVPIYGVEKYIKRCAISLFEQTYENIEYIFVNDCTKDNSIDILLSIIDKYSNRANNIKIINHDKNRGLGTARNTAVKNATGLFIMHVDSDDYVEPTIVEKLVVKQCESDADIVTCGYVLYRHNKIRNILPSPIYNIHNLILKILARDATMMIWGRLIRKSLYENNNITVPDGINMGEDYVTIPKLLFYAKKIDFVELPLYHYECYNAEAYTANISKNNIIQMIKSYENLREFFQNEHDSVEKINIAELKYIANCMLNCFANNNNLLDCYSILYNRKQYMDNKLYKHVKLSNRIVLYLKKPLLVKYYVKITKRIFVIISKII